MTHLIANFTISNIIMYFYPKKIQTLQYATALTFDIVNLCNFRISKLERQLEACLIVIICFTYLALTSGSSNMALAHYAEEIYNLFYFFRV
jgi:hypothetical protein